MKIHRILVGLDTSPRSEEVLRAAVELARDHGAKLVLFRGVGLQAAIPYDAMTIAPEGVAMLLEEKAKHDLDVIASQVPEELLEGVRAGLGTPWYAICESAKETHADLIVIGSHGYGALDRILGTTAAKVVNHADRSVLVVRAAP